MKVLILNSGIGKRMLDLTSDKPKCLVKISETDTILSRQLKILKSVGLRDILITTGIYDKQIRSYCKDLNLDLNLNFVKNPISKKSNYIYSIFLARKYLKDDILLIHGDLVFEKSILIQLLKKNNSYVYTTSSVALPKKDFKAILENNIVKKIGVEYFDNAITCQPLYFFKQSDWLIWLNKIVEFCLNGEINRYAEDALNLISDKINLYSFDFKDSLCKEIDTKDDLINIINILEDLRHE